MALNLKNPLGRRIKVKVNADVSSGAIKEDKGIIGIPVEHALSGNTVTFIQEGLVALTVSIGGTLGAGSFLYWDVGASALSIGLGAQDIYVGQIVEVLDSTNKVYLVRLSIGHPEGAFNGQREA
jgi:predicted RecA/RadA family phage recombinase